MTDKSLPSFSSLVRRDSAASQVVAPSTTLPVGRLNLAPGVWKTLAPGGFLGPNQLEWCRSNITGFKEYEEAAKRVRNLYEESKRTVAQA